MEKGGTNTLSSKLVSSELAGHQLYLFRWVAGPAKIHHLFEILLSFLLDEYMSLHLLDNPTVQPNRLQENLNKFDFLNKYRLNAFESQRLEYMYFQNHQRDISKLFINFASSQRKYYIY